MLVLRTFGGISLVGDSLPSSATQRRRFALLVLLARGRNRGVSRDKLLAYLWPESPSANARHALDQLLYATRRDLGRGAVIAEGGHLRLNSDLVGADCVEFEAYLERGELERAVALHLGPFLDGVHLVDSVEFERWVDAERAQLTGVFHGALERLATAATQRHDHAAAVDWWRRRAGAEPLNGRVALCLMQALGANGDRTGALRHARIHAALVRAELASEPDTAVSDFALQLAQSSAPAPPSRDDVAPAAQASRVVGNATLSAAPSPKPRRPALPAWSSDGPERRTISSRNFAAVLIGSLILALAGSVVFTRPQVKAAAQPPAQAPALLGARGANPEANALYLSARMSWNRRSREGLEEAVVLFRRATEQDPRFAQAYSGLAEAYVLLGYLGYVPGDAAFPKGKAAASRAVALDPDLGQAYAALGMALQWEKRWVEAEEAMLRAVEHAPDHATGHQWHALLLAILGRAQEAVTHARRAAELDPLSIQVHNTYGTLLHNAGQLDSALHVYERIVTNEPDTAWVRQNPWVLSNFGKVAAAAGRYDDAVRLIERAAEAVPGHPRPLYELAAAHLATGDRARAGAAFDRADATHPHYPAYAAFLHALLGDLDAAFDWLDRVGDWGPVLLLTLSGSPALDELRADPRYAALRRSTGLPEPRSNEATVP